MTAPPTPRASASRASSRRPEGGVVVGVVGLEPHRHSRGCAGITKGCLIGSSAPIGASSCGRRAVAGHASVTTRASTGRLRHSSGCTAERTSSRASTPSTATWAACSRLASALLIYLLPQRAPPFSLNANRRRRWSFRVGPNRSRRALRSSATDGAKSITKTARLT